MRFLTALFLLIQINLIAQDEDGFFGSFNPSFNNAFRHSGQELPYGIDLIEKIHSTSASYILGVEYHKRQFGFHIEGGTFTISPDKDRLQNEMDVRFPNYNVYLSSTDFISTTAPGSISSYYWRSKLSYKYRIGKFHIQPSVHFGRSRFNDQESEYVLRTAGTNFIDKIFVENDPVGEWFYGTGIDFALRKYYPFSLRMELSRHNTLNRYNLLTTDTHGNENRLYIENRIIQLFWKIGIAVTFNFKGEEL